MIIFRPLPRRWSSTPEGKPDKEEFDSNTEQKEEKVIVFNTGTNEWLMTRKGSKTNKIADVTKQQK